MKNQTMPPYFHNEAANSSKKSEIIAVQHNFIANTVTPAMQQYFECRKAYPDCLLFYRMGDFYELFFDDAVKASSILGIALTKRGKHEGEEIPMCGVPAHSADGYLETLIASGVKVAICEQMETVEEAKKRGTKAVMRREVVRVVTPGTITEDALLNAKQSSYLSAIAKKGDSYAFAWLEISTGEFHLSETSLVLLPAELARIEPEEILVSENLQKELQGLDWWQEWQAKTSIQSNHLFDADKAEYVLKNHYQLAELDALGDFTQADLSACSALINYLNMTQISAMPRLEYPKKTSQHSYMVIDAATRKNLELVHSLAGDKTTSLIASIDHTVTTIGARTLLRFLSTPLTVSSMINDRLDAVAFFKEQSDSRKALRLQLRNFPDLERSLSRICLERGSPRDMLAIRAGLSVVSSLKQHFITQFSFPLPALIGEALEAFKGYEPLLDLLVDALKSDVPMLARDGNFVKEGYHASLDEFRMLRDESKRLIATLETSYQQETGINGLKIRHNNVLGYYAEITALHQSKITQRFIHRQSLANNLRYTTTELGELERKIAEAGEKAIKLELEIFAELVKQISHFADSLSLIANAVARLDVFMALAELATSKHYTRPVVDDSSQFEIKGGRHPVVEAVLGKQKKGQFISNDCDLSDKQNLWLLTGPNMAGKSTFLRQNALIAILAQMGSFVPAEYAHIGVVDKLFSRVGAADDLARGRSTFMVEMIETATILNQATSRSLVILDEIGRGTATFDGLSIAWAVLEHLHNQLKCRSLFATHYHEMTGLMATLSRLYCCTMRVKEWKGDVIFLHEVIKGTADRSYGIHVAKIAGIPESVIKRAGYVLGVLEESKSSNIAEKLTDDLPLFRHSKPKEEPAKNTELETMLEQLNPDEFTPREALDYLYRLKASLR